MAWGSISANSRGQGRRAGERSYSWAAPMPASEEPRGQAAGCCLIAYPQLPHRSQPPLATLAGLQAGPTRSASTWRQRGTRSWGTHCMRRAACRCRWEQREEKTRRRRQQAEEERQEGGGHRQNGARQNRARAQSHAASLAAATAPQVQAVLAES